MFLIGIPLQDLFFQRTETVPTDALFLQIIMADVLICRVAIENGNLRLYGVENEYGNEVNFRPDEAFAGHLSYIIDCLPPVNGVDDVTTLKTEEEAV